MLLRKCSFFQIFILFFNIINWNSCSNFISSKFNTNDNIFYFYHIFWTNWIFIFLFSFSLYCIYKFNNNVEITSTVLFFLFTLYFFREILNSFVFYFDLSTFTGFFQFTNTFLTNTLNKFHPLFFYFSVLFFFSTTKYYYLYYNPLSSLFIQNTFYVSLKFIIYFLFVISFWMLFLGSWWAFQEATWGGWWNWDASEVFGLFFLFYSLKFIHDFYLIPRIVFAKYLYYMYTSIVVWLYILIQLNFDLSSHNFGIKFFFFFDNNFFFLELSSIFLILIIIGLSFYLNLSNLLNIFFSTTPKITFHTSYFIYSCIPASIVITICLFSFNSILNTSLWNWMVINTNLSIVFLQFYLRGFFFLYILASSLFKFHYFFQLIFYIQLLYQPAVIILFVLWISFEQFWFFHLLILYFILQTFFFFDIIYFTFFNSYQFVYLNLINLLHYNLMDFDHIEQINLLFKNALLSHTWNIKFTTFDIFLFSSLSQLVVAIRLNNFNYYIDLFFEENFNELLHIFFYHYFLTFILI